MAATPPKVKITAGGISLGGAIGTVQGTRLIIDNVRATVLQNLGTATIMSHHLILRVSAGGMKAWRESGLPLEAS